MALRKGTITENGIKIGWTETATGVSYSDGKTSVPSPANIDAKIAYKTASFPAEPKPPVDPPAPTVKLDHVYLAANSLDKSGLRAVNGDSVYTIPDTAGNYPLKYAGSFIPILTGRPPILWNGELLFDNEPHTLYNSNTFPRVAYPYEVTLVGRRLPGTAFEQYINDWMNDLTIGDSGSTFRSGDGDVNTQTYSNSRVNDFEVFVVHVLAESGKQTMWLNGRLLGAIASRTTSRRELNSVGVSTNNAQWNFIAEYVKHGKFTDQERMAHLQAAGVNHQQGIKPVQPYASDVSIIKGPEYTAKYTYNGVLPPDVSKTQYRWLGYGPGGLGGVKIIGTGASLPLHATSGYTELRVEVKVYDTYGSSFRYVSMPFTSK